MVWRCTPLTSPSYREGCCAIANSNTSLRDNAREICDVDDSLRLKVTPYFRQEGGKTPGRYSKLPRDPGRKQPLATARSAVRSTASKHSRCGLQACASCAKTHHRPHVRLSRCSSLGLCRFDFRHRIKTQTEPERNYNIYEYRQDDGFVRRWSWPAVGDRFCGCV